MTNYDFLVLSAEEFERFTRDLLQEVLGVFIESFTTGKDGGIDLRYAKSKYNVLIQCKRYTDYNNLYSNLKKEVEKVKKIAPKRYILSTSVGLTPNNKEEIRDLFDGYIKNTKDILGKDDLNNYLSMHEVVEKKYYKLWISSTNILNKIINARVYNQSEFKKQEIEQITKIFVQNKSFDEAVDILKKYRYVIISGIPGIGKTTLGSFLAYYLLASGSEEFVYISESINEAYEYFEPDKKQIFFFDDFLGQSNFTQEKLAINEENRILKFLDIIRNSKNKYMIFTTREYILQQAKLALEKINVIGDEYKCVVDLEKYNKESRGRILYNHIFYYSLPEQYIEIIVKEKVYLKIINHKNYSPRIISYFVKEGFWKNVNPKKYVEKIIEALDNPNMLWEHAYENQISELSRCILAVLTTICAPINIENLNDCVKIFLKKYSKYYCPYSESAFRKSIKELEDTFITNKRMHENIIVTEFQNPSVHDFLCYYYSKNINIMEQIIETSLYVNQLFEVFTDRRVQPALIKINNKIIKKRENRLLKDFDKLQYLSVYMIQNDGKMHYKDNNSLLSKLLYVLKNINDVEMKSLKEKLINVISNIDVNKFDDEEIEEYMDSINILKGHFFLDFINKDIFSAIFNNIETENGLIYFKKLKDIDPNIFEKFTESDVNLKKIEDVCSDSRHDYSDSDLETFKDNLEEISSSYGIDLEDTIQSVNERILEYQERISKYEPDYDAMRKEEWSDEKNEDEIIDEMFNSLLEGIKR
jgi:signal recognition particle GTPase